MNIRNAKAADLPSIKKLLRQLNYEIDESLLWININMLIIHPDEELVVCEEDNQVIAFISIHFIPQLAFKGSFARISYLVVDDSHQNKGIGQLLVDYCAELAIQRKCDRIELHCHEKREGAYEFYTRQGFVESPKYLMKKL